MEYTPNLKIGKWESEINKLERIVDNYYKNLLNKFSRFFSDILSQYSNGNLVYQSTATSSTNENVKNEKTIEDYVEGPTYYIPEELTVQDVQRLFGEYLEHNSATLKKFLKRKNIKELKKNVGYRVGDLGGATAAVLKYKDGRYFIVMDRRLRERLLDFQREHGLSEREAFEYAMGHDVIGHAAEKFSGKKSKIKLEQTAEKRTGEYFSYLLKEAKAYLKKLPAYARGKYDRTIKGLERLVNVAKERVKKVPRIYAPAPA